MVKYVIYNKIEIPFTRSTWLTFIHVILFTQTRGSGRGQGNASTEGKKKRSEDTSETSMKKPKQENSTASSTKV